MLNKYLRIVLSIIVLTSFTSCRVGRSIVYNFADINDHKKFPARTLEKEAPEFHFIDANTFENPLQSIQVEDKTYTWDDFLKKNKTVALLVIHKDTIKYHNYLRKYDQASVVPSFSMAKSITSILIGIAIDEQLIKSVAEPITNYIPELKDKGFEKVTIEHLLQMTSGLNYKESYSNPFGHAAEFYYGSNLRKSILKLGLDEEPGVRFEYASGSTQILGLVLERALKDRSITSYLEEKIWKPLGMAYDASWSIDRKQNGLEKTFCCINATALDYAKIGRLYLNKGNWEGKQIVSEAWVTQSTKVDTTNASKWYYQYQWWLPSKDGDFMAKGILGQYIYVNPEKDLIIVRLGKKDSDKDWKKIFKEIAEQY